jgi:hypothetical protein
MLEELFTIVTHRKTSLTVKHVEIIAWIFSYVSKASELKDEILDWLFAAEIDQSDINNFFESAEWSNVLHQAQQAEKGRLRKLAPESDGITTEDDRQAARRLVDPRKDYAVPRICSEFDITDEEAEMLDLTLLVSEKRRSHLRRRAEGVPEKGKQERHEPWRAEGISKAQYYRNRKQASLTLEERLLATVTEAAAAKPWPETVYETEFDIDMVAKSLTPPPPPPEPYRGTSEAARLANLAAELGLDWDDYDPSFGGWWYTVPKSAVLTEEDVAAIQAATEAAWLAEERKKALRKAQMYKKLADPSYQAELAAIKAERAEAALRGDPPRQISRAVWVHVPPEARERVRITAGLMMMRLYPADVGVAIGMHQVRREDAFLAALQAADPTVDMERARGWADSYWRCPTQEAVDKALKRFAEERAAYRAAEARVLDVIDRVSPPVLAEEREEVIAHATATLVDGPHNSPEHAVNLARDCLRDRRYGARWRD